MVALGQGVFSKPPIVMKANKVSKIDVFIEYNLSDVVTSEDGIKRRSFISVIMLYQFKSIPMVIKLEYFPRN